MEQPIVQAPIGPAAVPRLAAAVSNAGALGMVSLTWAPDAAEVIRQTAALTSRPFGGNLILEWDQHRRLDQALQAGLRIVSLTWGDPTPYVGQVHEADGLVLQTVGGAQEARRAVAAGVDVIVAQAWEAAGRPGPGRRPGEGEEIARGDDGRPVVRPRMVMIRSASPSFCVRSTIPSSR